MFYLHSIRHYWNRRKESKSNRKFHVNPKTIGYLNQVFLHSIEYTIVHHKKIDGMSEFQKIFYYSILVRRGKEIDEIIQALKAGVSEEILNWHSLCLSLSASICIA